MYLDTIILLHFTCCLFMCGLIWVIQIVHYPSFRFASQADFRSFSSFHVKSISRPVFPAMVIELLTGVLMFFFFPKAITLINLLLVLAIWLLTIFVSMPLHQKLSSEYNLKIINELIRTNWPRTWLWTLRSFLLFFLVLK